ncbi:unnamed protein product [Somion occarium]|uniref:Uncharacterized protein n=1 Tax=Somion occarium TaxID=3059160 RepID=A0ABP1CQD1_9APHY
MIITLVTTTDSGLEDDATIAFTVSPHTSEPFANSTVPIAWKVLTFHADEGSEVQVELNPIRRITVVTTHAGRHPAQRFVTYSDKGAGLGVCTRVFCFDGFDSRRSQPNHYASYMGAGQWSSDSIFNLAPNTSFAINRDQDEHIFSVGSSSTKTQFEPMMLLPSLKYKQGVIFQFPSSIQAYKVDSTCVVGQILTNLGPGLFTRDGSPAPLDTQNLKTDVSYRLYNRADGSLGLQTIHSHPIRLPQSTLPNMDTIAMSPKFLEELVTPPRTPPPSRLPSPSNGIFGRATRFLDPLHTPPRTPQTQLSPSLQPTITAPTTFLEPLPSPTHEMIRFYE